MIVPETKEMKDYLLLVVSYGLWIWVCPTSLIVATIIWVLMSASLVLALSVFYWLSK